MQGIRVSPGTSSHSNPSFGGSPGSAYNNQVPTPLPSFRGSGGSVLSNQIPASVHPSALGSHPSVHLSVHGSHDQQAAHNYQPQSVHPSVHGSHVDQQAVHHYHPVLVPESKKEKFVLCKFDPDKMSCTEFNTKVVLALIKVKKAYFVREKCTTQENAQDSLMLAIELYDKCEGSAKLLFASLEAQKEYLWLIIFRMGL
eukprot:CAMPEP_0172432806 /NCGR_PEP_ID=MMETSP1064-20121228/65039_1 /TAXON_ID=202472 /ORGANISM="Aulacoseira subarctica , Strain CCAP 1002/5" /LENGTH=198 /DNA_ID=CAMNT_0013180357 /DNA_START=716 /DNA_END=1309 /DNA_ORIENTATION=-